LKGNVNGNGNSGDYNGNVMINIIGELEIEGGSKEKATTDAETLETTSSDPIVGETTAAHATTAAEEDTTAYGTTYPPMTDAPTSTSYDTTLDGSTGGWFTDQWGNWYFSEIPV
jgi:hypothetical protein